MELLNHKLKLLGFDSNQTSIIKYFLSRDVEGLEGLMFNSFETEDSNSVNSLNSLIDYDFVKLKDGNAVPDYNDFDKYRLNLNESEISYLLNDSREFLIKKEHSNKRSFEEVNLEIYDSSNSDQIVQRHTYKFNPVSLHGSFVKDLYELKLYSSYEGKCGGSQPIKNYKSDEYILKKLFEYSANKLTEVSLQHTL